MCRAARRPAGAWTVPGTATADLALLVEHVGIAVAGERIDTIGMALPTTLGPDGQVTAWRRLLTSSHV